MCGITGYISPNNQFTESDLKKMTDAISHRGPDADGYFTEQWIGLGHRRLSIIDLSDAANQPMHSHCGRYVMVYNGEIYNYQEIRKEINESSHHHITKTPHPHIPTSSHQQITTSNFTTTSDTEVILEAFALWGKDFVQKLNGMFAIAIYDKEEKEIHLFRDRMGIKPLFYYYDGENFAFASELKALMQVEHIQKTKEINKQAIPQYLHLGYIPEPHTIYKNIYKFPSASYLLIPTSPHPHIITSSHHHIHTSPHPHIKKYWTPNSHITPNTISDESTAKNTLKDLIEKSVKSRLISDVPYGTFLSGGTDSSLVTAVAQKVNDGPIKTFSIGFKESKYNEAPYAKAVAKHLGTDHHEFTVSNKDAIELMDDIVSYYDEPYADSSAIPTMLVSKLAKQYVTMTLSGDGGDELFHGYGAYKWAKRLSGPFVDSIRKPAASLLSTMPDRYKRASHLFKYSAKDVMKSHIFSQEQYLFSREEIKSILSNEYRSDFILNENYDELNRKLSPAESQAFFDLNYYLKDDLLVKVDRAAMKYSLETRVPLLDHTIVEYALNIDAKLKTKGDVQKYILKEVLYDYVPRELFDRPKWGFSIPLAQWLKKELRYLIDDNLSKEIIEKHAVIDYVVFKEMLNRYDSGKYDYLYNRIWLLIILHKFLEAN